VLARPLRPPPPAKAGARLSNTGAGLVGALRDDPSKFRFYDNIATGCMVGEVLHFRGCTRDCSYRAGASAVGFRVGRAACVLGKCALGRCRSGVQKFKR
jgi:hypothetical protein